MSPRCVNNCLSALEERRPPSCFGVGYLATPQCRRVATRQFPWKRVTHPRIITQGGRTHATNCHTRTISTLRETLSRIQGSVRLVDACWLLFCSATFSVSIFLRTNKSGSPETQALPVHYLHTSDSTSHCLVHTVCTHFELNEKKNTHASVHSRARSDAEITKNERKKKNNQNEVTIDRVFVSYTNLAST